MQRKQPGMRHLWISSQQPEMLSVGHENPAASSKPFAGVQEQHNRRDTAVLSQTRSDHALANIADYSSRHAVLPKQ